MRSYGVPTAADRQQQQQQQQRGRRREQAGACASSANFRSVGIGNGSRGNNLGRLLRSVHHGAAPRVGFALVPCGHRTRRQYTRDAVMKRKVLEIDLPVNHTISHYFIMRPNVVQRAGQLSLPHVAISKTERKRTANIKPMSSSYNTPCIKHKLSSQTLLQQVSRCPPLRYGAACSSLAMSVPSILMVSRCHVSRF